MICDHLGIAVRDLVEAARLYSSAFGLEVTERYTLPEEGVRIAFLPSGEIDLELLEPIDHSGSVAKFLATRGPGLHHIAFQVPDIEAALARASTAGCTVVAPGPHPGARGYLIAFLHPSTSGGVLIEFVQR
ncbi:MAG TPA: methylmalonyl-CoA epimerase [bacterium]|nr:methylmalonyl-CoA epimerase [bacterium]